MKNSDCPYLTAKLHGLPLIASVLLLGTSGARAADLTLADFGRPFEVSKIVAHDAQCSRRQGEPGLLVATGHKEDWPGITIPAPAGKWDLSPYAQVAVKLKNTGTNSLTVHCRVDNPGADGRRACVTHSLELGSSQEGVLKVGLKRTHDDDLDGKLFGMRGYPVAPGGPEAVDPANITQLLIFVSKPNRNHEFVVENIRAVGVYTPPTAWVTDATPFFPFIDTFGQYRHKNWPGKVQSLHDLRARREVEASELAALPGPTNWDKYGGAASGPKLQATGFFRTQKVSGKWWLVDPEGRLFFSHGIDCVRAFDSTPIEDRQNWFSEFPGNQPEFQPFISHNVCLKGHYAGRSPECFSFVGANLLRKYGARWPEQYRDLVHRRLRSWGLNTIGNWSDDATRRLRRTPYTDSIGSGRTRPIAGSEGYWGKFPDVFDPAFERNLQRAMRAKQGDSAGDPWCIGYFSDNEMSWGDDLSLAISALQSPADQPVKQSFIAVLRAKYDTIEKLNDAWGVHYVSWDALAESREAPDKKKAATDLGAFYTEIAEHYFRTVREAIQQIAPNQLYLGCRFAWVNARAAAAAARVLRCGELQPLPDQRGRV